MAYINDEAGYQWVDEAGNYITDETGALSEQTLTIQSPQIELISEIVVFPVKGLLTPINSKMRLISCDPYLTTGGGIHYNTRHYIYNLDDYLICRHQGGNLTGTYTSEIYDLGAERNDAMVYALADIVVIGTGTTWDDQFGLIYTGSTLLINGDFENWTVDEADDWTESNCDAAEDGSGQSGSGCQITTSAALGNLYQNITVEAQSWYDLRGYYKNTAGDIAAIAIYDVDNSAYINPWGADGQQLSNNTSWTAFNYLFKTPVGCTTARIVLIGVGNGDIVGFDELTVKKIDMDNSTKWSDAGISTNIWPEIFELTAGPSVSMRLYYGTSSPPTSYIDRMEIISTVLSAVRYLQLRITITDPNPNVNALVENYSLKVCRHNDDTWP